MRFATIEARARGLRAQLDGVSDSPSRIGEEQVAIYRLMKEPAPSIIVRYYPPTKGEIFPDKLHVDLVIDCAGKVWSARVSGNNKAVDEYVKR